MYKQHSQNDQGQSGQIGVVILLIMSVLLTVGLSIARRTGQEADITSEKEQSVRVFNAAESGIERALSELNKAEKDGNSINTEQEYTGSIDSENYFSKLTPQDYVEISLQQNSSIEVPLSNSPTLVNISWWFKKSTNCSDNPAALLITAIDQNGSEISARHFYYGQCNQTGQTVEGFASVSPQAGSDYKYQINLSDGAELNDNTIALRISPIINDTQIKVTGDLNSGSQYSVIASGTDAGAQTARTVVVNRTRSAAPTFMNFSLVSGGINGGAGSINVTTD